MKIFNHLFITAGLCSLIFACGPNPATQHADAATDDTPGLVADSFGADFQATEVIAAPNFTGRYDVSAIEDTVATTLKGTVNKVCQAKGCWMTIDVGGEEDMMVKFKDYGFFMPMDISGREVVMNGIAFYQTTSVDELRHYAEDEGRSEKQIAMITEPKRELHFLADGVQLLQRD